MTKKITKRKKMEKFMKQEKIKTEVHLKSPVTYDRMFEKVQVAERDDG